MTSVVDAQLAVEAGVDAVGVILAPSPRRVSLELADAIARSLPPLVTLVAVVVDPPPAELGAIADSLPRAVVQFSGAEPAQIVRSVRQSIKVMHLAPTGEPDADPAVALAGYAGALLMFDTHSPLGGGSGRSFEWGRVAALASQRPIAISGGLTPETVGTCVRTVRPFAVDVRSGVETDGRKDVQKMTAFVRAVREADAST
ncbi:MAG: phosphoribosylanthranilate isomerase [Vulcanimicrobiaceae bacterium]